MYFALNEFKRQKTFSRWLKNVRAVRNENLIKPIEKKNIPAKRYEHVDKTSLENKMSL
jgi:hypothetical protein